VQVTNFPPELIVCVEQFAYTTVATALSNKPTIAFFIFTTPVRLNGLPCDVCYITTLHLMALNNQDDAPLIYLRI